MNISEGKLCKNTTEQKKEIWFCNKQRGVMTVGIFSADPPIY